MKTDNSELFEVVSTFVKGLLDYANVKHAGNCFLVSEILNDYLSTYWLTQTEFINVEVIEGKERINHYCLRKNNGEIIDGTASQFKGMPQIYIGKMPTNYIFIETIKPQRKHF